MPVIPSLYNQYLCIYDLINVATQTVNNYNTNVSE